MGTMSKTNESLHKHQQDKKTPALDILATAVSTNNVQSNDLNVLHTGETNTIVKNFNCFFDDFDVSLFDNLNSNRNDDLNINNSYDFDNEQDLSLFPTELRNNKQTEDEEKK